MRQAVTARAPLESRALQVDGDPHPISCLLHRPATARALYVLAHGAGAGMRHSFLEALAASLSDEGTGTLRYEFPYMTRGDNRPDPAAVCEDVVRRVVEAAAAACPDLPLFAGGKSFGGRMTTQAASRAALPGVRGIVLVGFPLHPPRRPATTRAEHLPGVPHPMLFLQGTRDELADLALLTPVLAPLGARAHLHVFEGADHSFHVLRRSGRTDPEVLAELARVAAAWMMAMATATATAREGG